jgi:ubiquinone/menaquinone biosynthesis C-methylase UbiE
MAKKFIEHTRKPESSLGGRFMLWGMNIGHDPCAKWGLSHVDLGGAKKILDIGCGGGKNMKNMVKRAPEATVCGIDYSEASVEKSLRFNRKTVTAGRAEVKEASVESIPYNDAEFDCVSAFETIYFWPDIRRNFAEAVRVLKKGGVFFICNEAQRPEGFEKWTERLNMTIYTGGEIKEHMEAAGLSGIEIHEHKNNRWLCVTGRK